MSRATLYYITLKTFINSLHTRRWIEATYCGDNIDMARSARLIELDHQRPVAQIAELMKRGSTLDSLEVKEVQMDICHWTNYAYLSSLENSWKSAKFPPEFKARLQERRASFRKAFKEEEEKGGDGMDGAIRLLQAKAGEDRFGLMPAEYESVRKAEEARRMDSLK